MHHPPLDRGLAIRAGIALVAAGATATSVSITPPPVLLAVVATALGLWCGWSGWQRSSLIAGRLHAGWQSVSVMCLIMAGALVIATVSGSAVTAGSVALGGVAWVAVAVVLLRPPSVRSIRSWRFVLDMSIAMLAVGLTAITAVTITGYAEGAVNRLAMAHIVAACCALLLLLFTNLHGGPGTATLSTLRTSGALAAVVIADLTWSLSMTRRADAATLVGAAGLSASFAVLAIAIGRERRHGVLPAPSIEAGSALRHPAWWMLMVVPAATAIAIDSGRDGWSLLGLACGLGLVGLVMVRQAISVSDARGHAFEWKRRIERDPLTGLFNNRAVTTRIEQDLVEGASLETYSLALVDIDDLDRVNRKFGSVVGDHALAAIAACIRRSCRATDVVARYAGDEFLILLPGVEATDARVVGDRVRHAVDRLHYMTGPEEAEAVGVSVGVTTTREATRMTAARLISAAEGALKHAKHAGTRRVRATNADEWATSGAELGERRRLLVVHPAGG